MNAEEDISSEQHRAIAVHTFNACWKLMESPTLTRDQEGDLLRNAYASGFHWAFVGDAQNMAIAEWMMSRVGAVIGLPDQALYHAERYDEIVSDNDLADWLKAFVFESRSRALACAGRLSEAKTFYQKAVNSGRAIAQKEERDIFERDLHREPWFGLDRT